MTVQCRIWKYLHIISSNAPSAETGLWWQLKKCKVDQDLGVWVCVCVCVCVCPLWLYKALLWVVKSATQMTQELKCWVIRLFVISTFFPSPLPHVNTRRKVVGDWHHQDRWVDVLCLQRQYPEKNTVSSLCLTAAKNAQLIPNWTITIRGTFCYSGAEGRGRTAVFKNANLTKDKEKLWKCSRSKEAKQTWQLSAHPGPRQEPVLEGECQKEQYKADW